MNKKLSKRKISERKCIYVFFSCSFYIRFPFLSECFLFSFIFFLPILLGFFLFVTKALVLHITYDCVLCRIDHKKTKYYYYRATPSNPFLYSFLSFFVLCHYFLTHLQICTHMNAQTDEIRHIHLQNDTQFNSFFCHSMTKNAHSSSFDYVAAGFKLEK